VVRVIRFVLATGCRWEDEPPELGCSGRTAQRRLRACEEIGCWDRLQADLLRLLRQAGKLDSDLVVIDSVYVRAFGGQGTGKSPVNRRKLGTKHTLLVSRRVVPLEIRTAGANISDHRQILPVVVLDIPRVGGKPGRPREHPEALYADRGYDSDSTRLVLRWLGIEPQIARRNTPHGSGLGRGRWEVERTISWIKGLRRIRVRYDRLSVMREAFTTLAASVVCFNILSRDTT
jgi:transposase